MFALKWIKVLQLAHLAWVWGTVFIAFNIAQDLGHVDAAGSDICDESLEHEHLVQDAGVDEELFIWSSIFYLVDINDIQISRLGFDQFQQLEHRYESRPE